MPAIIIDPRRPAIAWTKIDQSPVSFAAAARNVAPGESWAFHDHRTMQQVMADERGTELPQISPTAQNHRPLKPYRRTRGGVL